jgi:hypothetical protein
MKILRIDLIQSIQFHCTVVFADVRAVAFFLRSGFVRIVTLKRVVTKRGRRAAVV